MVVGIISNYGRLSITERRFPFGMWFNFVPNLNVLLLYASRRVCLYSFFYSTLIIIRRRNAGPQTGIFGWLLSGDNSGVDAICCSRF